MFNCLMIVVVVVVLIVLFVVVGFIDFVCNWFECMVFSC